MAVKFKIWVEIERIETDDNGIEVNYIDEECPIGVAYRDSIEDAVELQNEINATFGEICA